MAIENRNLFSVRLKELRKEYGYTTKQFAEFLDVGIPTYYAYENGRSVPSFDGLLSIAEKCDVTLDWLCGRNVNCKHSMNKIEITSVLKQLLDATKNGKKIEVQISCDDLGSVIAQDL